MKHIASLSGGQDSTAMTVRLLELGEPLDYIVFCDTGVEFPMMYDYIENLDVWLRKKYKIGITVLSGDTYNDVIRRAKTDRSAYAGRPKGITLSTRMDECTRDLKIRRIEKFCNSLDDDYINYIGYVFREVAANRGGSKDKLDEGGFRYPLYDWRWNERQVGEYLKKNGIYNHLYDFYSRIGCFLCPKQGRKDWFTLWKHFPSLFQQAKDMERWCEENDAVQKRFYWDSVTERAIPLSELEESFSALDRQGRFDLTDDSKEISCFCK